jgi:isopentenyl phosphate kinase
MLKVGGSLFSDKRTHRHVDEAVIARYARLIGDLAAAARGRLVLVVGGGAHAHETVSSLDRSDPFARTALTDANFTLLTIWSRALRSAGVPTVPLQLAAMCAIDADGLRVHGEGLRRWLEIGALPVICGDCLVGADGELEIFSSDRAAEVLLAAGLGPLRVVALTDVPGVLADGPAGTTVLREIDPDAPDDARGALWEAPPWDISRTMSGKLDALIHCAQQGAECFIMRGAPDAGSLRFLLGPRELWPPGLRYTRIARRRSRAIVRR